MHMYPCTCIHAPAEGSIVCGAGPSSSTSYLLLTTSYFLPPTSYLLLATSYCLLRTSHFPLPTSHFLLPTSDLLLPTSYLLPIVAQVPARRRATHALERLAVCTHAHMHTCTYAHMHIYTHAHMHTCIYARMHICTHAYMHTHAHMHICTHMHTCTRSALDLSCVTCAHDMHSSDPQCALESYACICTCMCTCVCMPCTRVMQAHTTCTHMHTRFICS